MALVKANYQLHSLRFVVDSAGVLTDVKVRVNASIVDDATNQVVTGRPTSPEISIWADLTPAQQGALKGLSNRIDALLPSLY